VLTGNADQFGYWVKDSPVHKRWARLFDPRMDASQMSEELQKWFARNSGELQN
jgi:hypothetical protein